MPIKLANNATSTIATAINASDVGVVLATGDGAKFPALAAGEYFYITFESTGGTYEIAKATARAGDSLTIVRAQEGTTAQSFAAGSRVELRVTAQGVEDLVDDLRADLAASGGAALIGNTPAGTIAATTVQGALNEIVSDLAASSGTSLVGHIQSGSGATARTVQAKLRESVSVKDFGAIGDGVTDDTVAIQNAINYASSLAELTAFGVPQRILSVDFPPAQYLVSSTITMNSNLLYCNLTCDGFAELVYTGTGACLHIGNDSANGILPVQIKNIGFFRSSPVAGSIGLWVQAAAYGYYEGIAVTGFETGIFNDGSIYCTYDLQQRRISNCVNGFYANTLTPAGGGLRYANNLLQVKNATFGGITGTAFTYDYLSASSGGISMLDRCLFENIGTGECIKIVRNGEVAGLDRFVVKNCWFENYGDSVARLTQANVLFENCFVAGGTQDVVIVDSASTVNFDQFYGYFLDSAPSSGTIITVAGGSTSYAGRFNFIDSAWRGSVKSFPWQSAISQSNPTPVSKAIKLNSQYPTGNNDNNYSLNLNLKTVKEELFGPQTLNTGSYVDFLLFGTDGASAGQAQYRLMTIDSAGTDVDLLVTIVAGTGITVSGTTLQFPASGGHWFNTTLLAQSTNITV